MKWLVSTIVLLAMGMGALGLQAKEDDPADIRWMTDVHEARVKAREEGRPLLVVFR